jgi:hypothetical protein
MKSMTFVRAHIQMYMLVLCIPGSFECHADCGRICLHGLLNCLEAPVKVLKAVLIHLAAVFTGSTSRLLCRVGHLVHKVAFNADSIRI